MYVLHTMYYFHIYICIYLCAVNLIVFVMSNHHLKSKSKQLFVTPHSKVTIEFESNSFGYFYYSFKPLDDSFFYNRVFNSNDSELCQKNK